ncbi:hypothetical protein ACIQU1_03265 [Streptomyces angustmyceticus]|uniref:TRAFAC clade GTPase domain-containing protein n=1 Tax=Streptomyces angustmyceticus TaxID=285578 RepID=UPI00381DA2C6
MSSASGFFTFALALTGAVGLPLCLGHTLWRFIGLSLSAATRVLGPRQPGVPDPRIPLVTGEPAQRAYWAQQMWVDTRSVAVSALGSIWYELNTEWLQRKAQRLFLGQRPANGYRGDPPIGRLMLILAAPGTAAGAVAGALLAAVFSCLVLAWFGLLLGGWWLVCGGAVVTLRGAEGLRKLVRGIRMKCPYPSCYRPFPLAVHRCPDCGAAHRALRPGRLGVLWHVCTCGKRLVTTAPAGSGRYATRCPHCDRQLPAAVGTTRVVHLPLVGGTSSGKTMLLAAMTAGLQSWSRRGALTVEYASATDQQDAGSLHQQLNTAGWALKTQGGQPRAFMLCVGHGRRRRLLYLYDPMGESLREAGTVREQQYLAHADGVILVADVLAEPQVQRALDDTDTARVTSARPSDQGPMETYQRLTGELAALTGRRGRIPVATVVTKRDVLDQITTLPVPGARIDTWLTAVGLGALVRGLTHDFGATRYWAVSAHAATGAGALDSEQRRAAEPVLWVLARTGLRTGSLNAEAPPVGVPGPRGGTVADRSRG